MRNGVSFLKQYCPGRVVSRRVRLAPRRVPLGVRVGLGLAAAVLAAVMAIAGAATVAGDSAPGASQSSVAAPVLALPGRPDPGLAAILLPRHAPPGAYRLAVIDQPIETARATVMAAIAPGARVDQPPGAWVVRQADPVEAFGEGGTYRRSRLARLFAGKPAHLLRAPIERDGQVVASVTLLSPCPDPQLSRLSPATIAILFDVAAARAK
jgi:hypothetical protein